MGRPWGPTSGAAPGKPIQAPIAAPQVDYKDWDVSEPTAAGTGGARWGCGTGCWAGRLSRGHPQAGTLFLVCLGVPGAVGRGQSLAWLLLGGSLSPFLPPPGISMLANAGVREGTCSRTLGGGAVGCRGRAGGGGSPPAVGHCGPQANPTNASQLGRWGVPQPGRSRSAFPQQRPLAPSLRRACWGRDPPRQGLGAAVPRCPGPPPRDVPRQPPARPAAQGLRGRGGLGYFPWSFRRKLSSGGRLS